MRIRNFAVASLLAAFASAPLAQSEAGLQIHPGEADALFLVSTSGGPAVDLVRSLLSQPGRATDGTPVAIAGAQPSQCAASRSVAIHPNGRFVYTTSDAGVPGSVCAYEFNPQTMTLVPVVGSPFPAGRGTRAVAVDPGGRFVYAANFIDGSITGYTVNASTGALNQHGASPYVSTDANTGHLVIDPLGRFLYATNSDTNGTVSGFAIDRDNGQLTHVPFSPFKTPPFPGALAIDPRGKYVYVAASPNQVFSINPPNGQLTPTNATFAPLAQAMAFDPTGRYLVATSGSPADGRLNTYRIDAVGTPVAVDAGVATGRNPLGVAVSRTGRHVYTANEADGNVSGFRLDYDTGALAPIEGTPFAGAAGMADVATFGSLSTTESWLVNEPLARPIVSYGGRLPLTRSISQGALPPGLSFLADIGVVAGTPTAPGTYPFTLRVVDEYGGATSRDFTFTVRSDVAPVSVTVVEYYNVSLDHYFITWLAAEIAALDAGTTIKGWARTGKSFNAYVSPQSGTSPICRYYIPPALGDSHFFGRGTVECNATGAANPSFVLEDPAFMHMILPVVGTCPANTTPVYRVFSNRPDANHRYTTDRAVRDAMVAQGWLAEGDGADLVVMCAPATLTANSLNRA